MGGAARQKGFPVRLDRITTLMGKELREFRASPTVLIPVVLLIVVCTVLPFVVVVAVPWGTGAPLTSDQTFLKVITLARQRTPDLAAMPLEMATQVFLFQQFLLLYLIAPIVGAVSLAAYTVVGEKQGRTLEPLLTTPMSTAEILIAKVLASFLPSLVIEALGLCLYAAAIALVTSPAVLFALLSWRSLLLVGLLGPFASLAALQATIAVSSRVNDPRSAQQVAVLLILPLIGMLIGQMAGILFVTTAVLLLLCLAMIVVWGMLILLSVALFERETILTRWT
jgi:ABC-2 type transport system permease protein